MTGRLAEQFYPRRLARAGAHLDGTIASESMTRLTEICGTTVADPLIQLVFGISEFDFENLHFLKCAPYSEIRSKACYLMTMKVFDDVVSGEAECCRNFVKRSHGVPNRSTFVEKSESLGSICLIVKLNS